MADQVAVRFGQAGGQIPLDGPLEPVAEELLAVGNGRFVKMTNLHDSAEMVRQLAA
ncbi:hypothetical protein AB0C06_22680 [Micromonospora inaquosa]|uniref:hypothetical protein n=1 Tax=Micromonospora inaquosa TaxID=2203716 RepID=UPI0033D5F850